MKIPLLTTLFLLLVSCTHKEKDTDLEITIDEIPTNSINGGESNLCVSSNGQIILNWIEYKNDSTDVLQFSRLENDRWSDPQQIAEGSNWFVNWADFPSLKVYKDNNQHICAHWLQKSNIGTYDYDVRISQSLDAGKTWSPSFVLHNDKIAAEHGFVSMVPISSERMLATWLDGRHTKGHSHDSHDAHHTHDGAMTLRTAEFDISGKIYHEEELDNKVCDCCQTDIALTNAGPLIVYRDRLDGEIRDISYVRKVKGKWSEPKTIASDNWVIAGCPVNGPSVAADGNNVVVAWYTMQNDTARIRVSFSDNSGSSFQPPIEISNNNALGRLDVVLLNRTKAGVSWMESNNEEAVVKFATVDQIGKLSDEKIITTSKSSRNSGFPKMVKHNDQLIFAWTHVEDEITYVKSAKVTLK